jgi:hypothetical protein
MTICGYNAKIGAGLNLLIEGMASSMDEKAMKVGAIKALDDELFELQEMIDIMQNQGPVQEIFVGLNLFAKKLFIEVKEIVLQNPDRSISDIMEDIGPKFVSTIKYAEEFRESLNEPSLVKNNEIPIRIVANWVNDNASRILDGDVEFENR